MVLECGGQDRPYSDVTEVAQFYPGRDSLPEETLTCIQTGITRRCRCEKFGPVRSHNIIGQLQERVRRQHIRQGRPIKQSNSSDQCCA